MGISAVLHRPIAAVEVLVVHEGAPGPQDLFFLLVLRRTRARSKRQIRGVLAQKSAHPLTEGLRVECGRSGRGHLWSPPLMWRSTSRRSERATIDSVIP